MATIFDANISANLAHSNLDSNYGPYANTKAAYDALCEQESPIPGQTVPSRIALGLTVGINTDQGIVEYWWKNGTGLSDLIKKESGLPGGMKVAVFDKNANNAEGRQNSLLSDLEGWVVLPETTTFRYDEHEFEGWANTAQGEVLESYEVHLLDDKTMFYAKWSGQVTKYDITIPSDDRYTVASVAVDNYEIQPPYKSEAGRTVEITLQPIEGYNIDDVKCDVQGAQWDNGKLTFTMPAAPAAVTNVTTSFKSYVVSVVVEPQDTCNWTINGESGATEKDVEYTKEVVIKYTPNEGKEMAGTPSIDVAGVSLNWEDDTLTFVMPNSAVTVTAQTKDAGQETSTVRFEDGNYTLERVSEGSWSGRTCTVPQDHAVTVTLNTTEGYEFSSQRPAAETGEIDISEWNSVLGIFKMHAVTNGTVGVTTQPSVYNITLYIDDNCSIDELIIGENTPEPPAPGQQETYEAAYNSEVSIQYVGEEIDFVIDGIKETPEDNRLSFTMPNNDVTINATAGAVVEECTVTFNLTGCTLATFNGRGVQSGTTVVQTTKGEQATFTLNRATGYEAVTSITGTTYDSGTGVFTIPAAGLSGDTATFTATATGIRRNITVTCSGCTYNQSVANPVPYGRSVTLTFTANKDYTLNGAIVTSSIGVSSLDENDQITFNMPENNVTISVTAQEEEPGETITLDNCVMFHAAMSEPIEDWERTLQLFDEVGITKDVNALVFNYNSQTSQHETSEIDLNKDPQNLGGVTLLVPAGSTSLTGMVIRGDKTVLGDDMVTVDDINYEVDGQINVYTMYYVSIEGVSGETVQFII